MSRRVIDCTKVLRHGAAAGFTAREFERAGEPQTLVHRIEMDADIGTHVLAPRRYARWGSDLADLAPESFFGEGLVAHIEVTADAPDIDSNRLEDACGRDLHSRDIVVIAAHGEGVVPCFTAQAAQWLFVRGAKLVALADGVCVGREEDPNDERVILSTLLETDVPVVRGLVKTEQLSTERMAFMALPAPAADVTAWPVRFIALDPGLAPAPEASSEDADVDETEATDELADPETADDPADDPAGAAPVASTEPTEPTEATEPTEPTEPEDAATAAPAPDEPSAEAAPDSAPEDDQPSVAEPAEQDDPKDSDETDAKRPNAKT